MKRIGAILCLVMIMVMSMSVFAFADTTEGEDVAKGVGQLEIEKVSPKDGQNGIAIQNSGYKVFFNEEVYTTESKVIKANREQCKVTYKNSKGKTKVLKTQIVFSEDHPEVMLVLAEGKLKDKTKYTLTIGGDFAAANGDTLGKEWKTSATTLNSKSNIWISVGLMALMTVGMVFLSVHNARKEIREAEKARKANKTVNPYKVAREKGKSVEEIVAQQQKKKAKAIASAQRKAKQKKENKVEIADGNIRVSRPRPISEAGSTYKAKKK